MANGTIERIDSLYDVAKITKENITLINQLKTLLATMDKVQGGISKVANSKGGGGLAAAANEMVAAQSTLTSELKKTDVALKQHGDVLNAIDKQTAEAAISATEYGNSMNKSTQKVKEKVVANKQLIVTEKEIALALAQDKLLMQQRNQQLKNQVREELAVKGSLEQRRAALIRLNAVYDNQSPQERASASGQRLQRITQGLTLQVKELEKGTGRTARNVGNYQQDIERAAISTNSFAKSVGKAYGFVRVLANILPGLGISGIFLLAYEGIKKVVDSMDLFGDKAKKLSEGMQGLKDSSEEFDKSLSSVKESAIATGVRLQSFVDIAKDGKRPLDERNYALREANEILGEHGEKLTLVNINSAAATEEIKKFTQALVSQALAAKYADRIAELYIMQGDALERFNKKMAEGKVLENEVKGLQGNNARDLVDQYNDLIAKRREINDQSEQYKTITKEIIRLTGRLNEEQLKSVGLFTDLGTKEKPVKTKKTKEVKDTLEKDLKSLIEYLKKIGEESPVVIPYQFQPYKGMDTTAAYEAEIDRRLVEIDTKFANRQLVLARQYRQGVIDKKEYEEELYKTTEEYATKGLEIQIEVLERQKEFAMSDIEQTQEVIDKKYKLEKQIAELKLKLEKQKQDAIDKTREKEAKSTEEQKKAFQDFLQFADQAVGNAFKAIGEIASIGFDTQKVKLDELESKQQENYEREINRINNLNISDAQRADMLSALEAKRTAEKLNTERKLRKIEVERARFEKAANIANIITSTALAVVNALKTGGPFAIPLSVTIGALGAAQLARAIAVPLPKYEKGTESAKRGWSIYGEKGTEVVERTDGTMYLTPNKPTLAWLEGGEKITPNYKLSEKLGSVAMRKPVYYRSNTDNGIGFLSSSISCAIGNQTYRLEKAMKRKNRTIINNNINIDQLSYLNRKVYNR